MQVKKQQLEPGMEQQTRSKLRKEYIKSVYCHPACIHHAKSKLDEPQARNKIFRRNINNLRYTNDSTLIAESKEELKILLMMVKKESEKAGLKLNIQKTKIMANGLITSWQIDGENGNSDRFYFLRLQNHCRWWLKPWN